MKYLKALRARRLALLECELARREVDAAVGEVVMVYRSHPTPFLTAAIGVGFVLAQLHVGSGWMKAGVRITTGSAWSLLRQFIRDLD